MSEITVARKQPMSGHPLHRRPRGPRRRSSLFRLAVTAALAVASWWLLGCQAGTSENAPTEVAKTPALERAERRLFDGAPPVIPHDPLGAACVTCHHAEGVAVPDLGFAPPSPHAGFGSATVGMSAISRCRQCHVFQQSEALFVANDFEGLRQDLRRGRRLNPLAPPVIPHRVFMREACLACHGGTAAREAIRTSHPERTRCLQCHLEQKLTTPLDPRPSQGGSTVAEGPVTPPRSAP